MSVLFHPVTAGVQAPPVVFSTEFEGRAFAEDREIISRIVAAYRAAVKSASASTRQSMAGTIWAADGFGGQQAELIAALEAGSAEKTHDVLRRFFVSGASHGIAMGRPEAEAIRGDPARARHYGLMWLDGLLGLANTSGALPLINPEDNYSGWERALELDVENVAAAIEQHLGVTLEFPGIMGAYGAPLHGRPFPYIAFAHLVMASSIRPWLEARGKDHVVEIGGGFGDLALWTTRLAPCRYSIYDLPFANAAQAYFLWRARPGKPLRLAGEGTAQRDEIALLPAWELLSAPPESADVVVNQDSLVEIPRATAASYLKAMQSFLKGPFLSVNHESPQRLADQVDRTSVAALIESVGGYLRLSRVPFPLRMGYAQEIYVLREPVGKGLLRRLGRAFSR